MTLAPGQNRRREVSANQIKSERKNCITRTYPESADFDAFPPIFSNFFKAFGSKSTTNQICSSENAAMTQYD